MESRPKNHRVLYLLLGFVFFSIAAIMGFGFNIFLALGTFVAAQLAFMILWSQFRLRNKLRQ